jgi:hypothetical protein
VTKLLLMMLLTADCRRARYLLEGAQHIMHKLVQ